MLDWKQNCRINHASSLLKERKIVSDQETLKFLKVKLEMNCEIAMLSLCFLQFAVVEILLLFIL